MGNVTKPGVQGRQWTATDGEGLAPREQEKLLVHHAQEGNVSAYEELVRVHQRRLLAVIGGILRGSQDVEDVAQQALAMASMEARGRPRNCGT